MIGDSFEGRRMRLGLDWIWTRREVDLMADRHQAHLRDEWNLRGWSGGRWILSRYIPSHRPTLPRDPLDGSFHPLSLVPLSFTLLATCRSLDHARS
jgi:hypothetical protein